MSTALRAFLTTGSLGSGPCVRLKFHALDKPAGPNDDEPQNVYSIHPHPLPIRALSFFCEHLRAELAPYQAPNRNARAIATHSINGPKSLLSGYQEIIYALADWSNGHHYPFSSPRFPDLSYGKTARVHHVSTLLQFHPFIAEAEARLGDLPEDRPLNETELHYLLHRSGIPHNHLAIRLVAVSIARNILKARAKQDRKKTRQLESMCERLGEDFADHVQSATGGVFAGFAADGPLQMDGADDEEPVEDPYWRGRRGGGNVYDGVNRLHWGQDGYRVYPYPFCGTATGIRMRADTAGNQHREFIRPSRRSSEASCVVM